MHTSTQHRRAGVTLVAAVTALALVTTAGAAAAGDLDTSFGDAGAVFTNLGSGTEFTSGVALQPDGKIVVAGTNAPLAGFPDFAVLRYEPDGTLDPTFGSGGIVLSDIASSFDFANAVALLPSGKIVVAGNAGNDFALARYAEDGSPDPSFGSDGKVVTDIASSSGDAIRSVAIQPNGKIVTGGVGVVGGDNDFTLARYDAAGNLDPGFGSGGVLRVDLGSTSDNLDSIELLPGGKILAIGSSSANGGFDFAVVRLNSDGSLDQSFGTSGMVFTDVSGGGDFVQAVEVQQNGKIIATGSSGCCVSADFQLVRYNADGSLDTSFDSDGIVVTDLGSGNETPSDVAITPSGKVVVVGVTAATGTADIAVVRYDPDGRLDSGFGSAGIVLTDFGSSNERAAALALQPDGRIMVAGNGTTAGSFDTAHLVVRYLAR